MNKDKPSLGFAYIFVLPTTRDFAFNAEKLSFACCMLLFARIHPFLAIGLALLLLASCSANTIQRISHNGAFVERAKDGRYDNLFPGFKDYPFTCEDDCYAEHPDVKCLQENLENCQFVGMRPEIETHTGFSLQWLGHASFLITSADQKRFLFDPVSKQFDWPVNWAHSLTGGHVRAEPQWLSDSAQIDAVLYSHLHYDHFSKRDIQKLGNGPTYFVHQDTADYLPDSGLSVVEMAWYAHDLVGNTRVYAMPAHHFNSRFYVPYIYEDNEQALWGGWLLERAGKTVFFAGDTGYSPHFKAIAKAHGNIDICLIPIASYFHPQYAKWYRYVHTTPEDALLAAKELGCGVMIPWGYGNASWQMGDKSSHSALVRLLNMHPLVHPTLKLLVLNEGDSINL